MRRGRDCRARRRQCALWAWQPGWWWRVPGITGPVSTSLRESFGQAVGKTGGQNLFLCVRDFVGNAVKGDETFIGIVQQKRRAGIAIAGLTDVAGVDQISGLGLQ